MNVLGKLSILASLGVMACSSSSSTGSGLSETSSLAPPPVPRATDTRSVITAATPPPPISGGTLLVTHDGKLAVAADPDRDRVSIVSLPDGSVLQTVRLNPGDEPGRVVEDANGRVHVALRRGGSVVAIDLATGAILSRRAACGVPRGLAYDSRTDLIHVACGNGQLVTFAAGGGAALRTLTLDVDLRDVMVTPDGLAVSRFKSAEVLRLDANGNVVARIGTHGIVRESQKFLTGPGQDGGGFSIVDEPIEPAVAWRTVASQDGEIVMLHQYALAAPVVVDDPRQATQPYGAPLGGCGGLVQPAVTLMDEDGSVHMGAPIPGVVLAVDVAVSPDGHWVAVAQAGNGDPMAPSSSALAGLGGKAGFGSVAVFTTNDAAPLEQPSNPCAGFVTTTPVVALQPTAVAFTPDLNIAAQTGVWLVAQTREPPTLVFVPAAGSPQGPTIDLGGPSVLDTGHDIFHRDAGAGIACASCHPEGGEDGRVWQFQPLGNRRTQAVDVGLAGTAPFHWDGDMATFDKLVTEVFVHRMGGPNESPERSNALSDWVFSLAPRSPIVPPTDDAAVRGRALFESQATGCTTCHSGDKFTSNANAEVGTTERGHSLQVPSLRGVGYRAPFLHDGRAASLTERFDPAKGGGDAHGHTSNLSAAQVGDLVAYLGSL